MREEAHSESGGAHGAGWVELPNALTRKYPNAGRDWGWQWVFPSHKLSTDPRSGEVRRHHLNEGAVSRSIGLQADVSSFLAAQLEL